MSENAASIVPVEKRKLRACLLCGLIKTQNQFRANGCDNCDDVLHLKGHSARVLECTSPNFSGCIAMMQPERSWVARWQRIDKFTKGLYAIKVLGKLPEEIQEELEDKGIKYQPRDGSMQD
ncbi:hypothetical protein PIROE2DRAFT_37838 [Piromyces sp. E2]|uniref:Transcription elongation factor SPT4 n=1 Tax=Piromyces finnis TaxID=1754191 RepID=A0A1Y1V0Z3_9FUNG|nr:transcription initiation Spt4 [Piromyces finnis]OUM69949.1 hypothetical protein PIROE2DRAFT_37838 [Piromyces sp. E2]|eukprot:ORX44190.1 transcription initiation Spt4 [Piromyces finnis]